MLDFSKKIALSVLKPIARLLCTMYVKNNPVGIKYFGDKFKTAKRKLNLHFCKFSRKFSCLDSGKFRPP